MKTTIICTGAEHNLVCENKLQTDLLGKTQWRITIRCITDRKAFKVEAVICLNIEVGSLVCFFLHLFVFVAIMFPLRPQLIYDKREHNDGLILATSIYMHVVRRNFDAADPWLRHYKD